MIGNAHDMALSGAVGETMQNMNLKGLSAPVALMTTLMYTYLPHIATAWDDGPWPLCSLCVFSDKSWHYNGQLGTVEWVMAPASQRMQIIPSNHHEVMSHDVSSMWSSRLMTSSLRVLGSVANVNGYTSLWKKWRDAGIGWTIHPTYPPTQEAKCARRNVTPVQNQSVIPLKSPKRKCYRLLSKLHLRHRAGGQLTIFSPFIFSCQASKYPARSKPHTAHCSK